MSEDEDVPVEPKGRLEFRSATLNAVSFPDRTCEVVVMPYEEETVVDYDGRMVTEVISRGAFSGIQRRNDKIKANRDHQVSRSIGRCVALHPNRPEGLVADIRISDTPLGDETLTLANDGVLDISAGFMPMPGGQTWETRSRRRITKAWLGHIAFVPEPAYESARVLSVRSSDPVAAAELTEAPGGVLVATPNLDRIRAEKLQEMYDRLQ